MTRRLGIRLENDHQSKRIIMHSVSYRVLLWLGISDVYPYHSGIICLWFYDCSSDTRHPRRTYAVNSHKNMDNSTCNQNIKKKRFMAWWRHQMETFSALLAICAGNSPVPGEFPAQRPVTRSSGVFFDLRLNKRLSKQSWGWWFETLSCPLWRHCNVYIETAGRSGSYLHWKNTNWIKAGSDLEMSCNNMAQRCGIPAEMRALTPLAISPFRKFRRTH